MPTQVKMMGGGKEAKQLLTAVVQHFHLHTSKCFPKAGRLLKGELMSVVIYSVAEP